MNNYLENLKTKPEHVKKRFAFLVSFAISFVIFAGWIASYGLKSSPVLTDKEKVDAPVSSLTASVIGAYEDIKNMIFGSNKMQYEENVIEVSGGER
ncbi:MAG TPA: hypothetical protein VJI66_01060 [Candidatus Paceibacterota bacterium]